MERFTDKTAVVTGGGSGIGRAIAQRLAEEGARVLIVGRTESTLKETAAPYEKISYIVGDITDSKTVREIAATVKNAGGRLDVLVNNAGRCQVQPLTQITAKDYDSAFNPDVRALVEITAALLPFIIEIKGNIINMSIVGAAHPGKNLSMYVGAKAAVENFTRSWALELAEKGVRVNAIAPGAIRTNIWNVTDLSAEDAKRHEDGIAATIPFGRFGRPEEVAAVAAFLASEEAGYVSGSVYAVDGGMGAM